MQWDQDALEKIIEKYKVLSQHSIRAGTGENTSQDPELTASLFAGHGEQAADWWEDYNRSHQ